MLAVGQFMVKLLPAIESRFEEVSVFFAFVAFGKVLMAGPLIWAVLVRKGARVWIALALIAIGLLIYGELELFQYLKMARRINDYGHFLMTVTATYVVAIGMALSLVRFDGWRLQKETN